MWLDFRRIAAKMFHVAVPHSGSRHMFRHRRTSAKGCSNQETNKPRSRRLRLGSRFGVLCVEISVRLQVLMELSSRIWWAFWDSQGSFCIGSRSCTPFYIDIDYLGAISRDYWKKTEALLLWSAPFCGRFSSPSLVHLQGIAATPDSLTGAKTTNSFVYVGTITKAWDLPMRQYLSLILGSSRPPLRDFHVCQHPKRTCFDCAIYYRVLFVG